MNKHTNSPMLAAFAGLLIAMIGSPCPAGIATDAGQEIPLAAPFGDHAVLQQKIPLPVWGTTLPGAKVTLAFETLVKTTMADAEGRWRMVLDQPLLSPPSGPTQWLFQGPPAESNFLQ